MQNSNNLSSFDKTELLEGFELAWQKLMERANAIPQNNKTAFVLGGQPGSGKSSSAEKIKQEFLGGNCIFISGDDFRKYHPKYKEINEQFHSQMHEYTSEFASKMTELSIRRAAERNYNIIIEGTFRTTKAPLYTLEQLKQNGYKTGVAIVACPKDLSWLSAIERYKKERETGGDGRVVSKEAHDYVVSVLGDNAQSVYNQKNVYDAFVVYKRDNKGVSLIYNNKTDKEFNKKIIENVLNDKSISKELAVKNQKSVNLNFSKGLDR
ncbi:MAG: zeta toxin family protein [Endomicrobium sp.]|jgi:UDP-N-acetylglucosamine kinase|nr:zeta toxin family protein [Endomicrobium sp.]